MATETQQLVALTTSLSLGIKGAQTKDILFIIEKLPAGELNNIARGLIGQADGEVLRTEAQRLTDNKSGLYFLEEKLKQWNLE